MALSFATREKSRPIAESREAGADCRNRAIGAGLKLTRSMCMARAERRPMLGSEQQTLTGGAKMIA